MLEFNGPVFSRDWSLLKILSPPKGMIVSNPFNPINILQGIFLEITNITRVQALSVSGALVHFVHNF